MLFNVFLAYYDNIKPAGPKPLSLCCQQKIFKGGSSAQMIQGIFLYTFYSVMYNDIVKIQERSW
jgi:hypothetical protein